jgi:hypothetical protein
MLNQNETDVDCGGLCTPCTFGETCEGNEDCVSMNCVDTKCRKFQSVSTSNHQANVVIHLQRVPVTTASRTKMRPTLTVVVLAAQSALMTRSASLMKTAQMAFVTPFVVSAKLRFKIKLTPTLQVMPNPRPQASLSRLPLRSTVM